MVWHVGSHSTPGGMSVHVRPNEDGDIEAVAAGVTAGAPLGRATAGTAAAGGLIAQGWEGEAGETGDMPDEVEADEEGQIQFESLLVENKLTEDEALERKGEVVVLDDKGKVLVNELVEVDVEDKVMEGEGEVATLVVEREVEVAAVVVEGEVVLNCSAPWVTADTR